MSACGWRVLLEESEAWPPFDMRGQQMYFFLCVRGLELRSSFDVGGGSWCGDTKTSSQFVAFIKYQM